VLHTDDTIAAIASAPGGSLRGIVRLSGPHTTAVIASCFRANSGEALSDLAAASVVEGVFTTAAAAPLALPASVYLWPDERSYTKQPAAEIHTVGNPSLVSAVLSTLFAAGARPAEPGEFTLRAFLAGRIDLTQAEAVLGVIEARGTSDLKVALEQLAGNLARPLSQLREQLLELLAHLEAGLDFVEEDIEFVSRQELESQLDAAAAQIAATIAQLGARRRGDALPCVVLTGWPNVGKSSLFNALAGGAKAIVSSEAGTTRDYLTATLDLAGLNCRIIDTAGHETASAGDAISAAAQELSRSQVIHCDLELFCIDGTRKLNAWECARLPEPSPTARIVVATKLDGNHDPAPALAPFDSVWLATSAATGRGIATLRNKIRTALADQNRSEQAASSTAERSADSLRLAQLAIDRAREIIRQSGGEELIAAELRSALADLGRVVGAVYTDDILDRVFSRFCIGK
jgi:tRNA modification GTPase